MKKKSLLSILFVLTISFVLSGQERIIFSPEKEPPRLNKKDTTSISSRFVQMKDLKNGWGGRIFINTFGFGVGVFYRYQFDDELAYQAELEISSGKAENEFEQYSYYGTFTPNKLNSIILFPINNAVTYRLFKDDIVDNFRPFLTGSVGPLIAYEYPYDAVDSFSGFGHGLWKLGFTGSIGFGADFGGNLTSIQGVSLKYILHYLPQGTPLMGHKLRDGTILDFRNTYIFQGVQISLNLGRMFVK